MTSLNRTELNCLKQLLLSVNASNYRSTLDQLICLVRKLADETTIEDDILCESLETLHGFLKNKSHHYIRPSLNNLVHLAEELDNSRIGSLQTLTLTKCINHCVKRVEFQPADIDSVRTRLLKFLSQNVHLWIKRDDDADERDELAMARVIYGLTVSFKTIIISFKLSPSDSDQVLGQFLSTLRLLLFIGLPGYKLNKQSSSPLYASPINLQSVDLRSLEQPAANYGRTKNKRRSKSKNRASNLMDDDVVEDKKSEPSDSEMSSSEISSFSGIDMKAAISEIKSKIRCNAYELLEITIKQTDKRIIFGYWSSFLPDTPAQSHQYSVLTSILKDPSFRARCTALTFLKELLSGGRQFVLTLADASKPTKSHSFTPMSVTLAAMIAEVHRSFVGFLFIESASDVLVQGLKCLSVLVQSSPYTKLEPGLAIQMLQKTFLLYNSTKDVVVLTAVMTVFTDILAAAASTAEMKKFAQDDTGINIMTKLEQFSIKQIEDLRNIQLCGECLKFLTALLKVDFSGRNGLLQCSLSISNQIANASLTISNPVLQSHVCKYVHEIASVLKADNLVEGDQTKWWLNICQTELFKAALGQSDSCLHDSSISLVINTISLIPDAEYSQLPRPFTCNLIILLFSMCSLRQEEEAIPNLSICASAMRCLGVFVTLDSNIDDWNFLSDVISACQSTLAFVVDEKSKDSTLLFCQSSWTAANLCETLKRTINDAPLEFGIESNVCMAFGEDLLSCLSTNVIGAQGDTIKTNLVRAISNLCHVILCEQFAYSERRANLIKNSISSVTNCFRTSKQFKIHWNCSYALTSLFQNQRFQKLIASDEDIPTTILDSLEQTMQTTKNHKVMSYTAEALAAAAFLMDENRKSTLAAKLVDLFMDKYFSVPFILKLKWVEKIVTSFNLLKCDSSLYGDSLSKLLLFLNENSQDTEVSEMECIKHICNT